MFMLSKSMTLVNVDFKIVHKFSLVYAHTSDMQHIDPDFTANDK